MLLKLDYFVEKIMPFAIRIGSQQDRTASILYQDTKIYDMCNKNCIITHPNLIYILNIFKSILKKTLSKSPKTPAVHAFHPYTYKPKLSQ